LRLSLVFWTHSFGHALILPRTTWYL
jgi:hypothetical protein